MTLSAIEMQVYQSRAIDRMYPAVKLDCSKKSVINCAHKIKSGLSDAVKDLGYRYFTVISGHFTKDGHSSRLEIDLNISSLPDDKDVERIGMGISKNQSLVNMLHRDIDQRGYSYGCWNGSSCFYDTDIHDDKSGNGFINPDYTVYYAIGFQNRVVLLVLFSNYVHDIKALLGDKSFWTTLQILVSLSQTKLDNLLTCNSCLQVVLPDSGRYDLSEQQINLLKLIFDNELNEMTSIVKTAGVSQSTVYNNLRAIRKKLSIKKTTPLRLSRRAKRLHIF